MQDKQDRTQDEQNGMREVLGRKGRTECTARRLINFKRKRNFYFSHDLQKTIIRGFPQMHKLSFAKDSLSTQYWSSRNFMQQFMKA